MSIAVTAVDLARVQFATTSIYHFLFVPLSLGLAPLVAVTQTLWHRTGSDAWLRLTKFFGTLKGEVAWLAWGSVHLALLSTGEDRAKAVVEWTWAGFTHDRAARISVEA